MSPYIEQSGDLVGCYQSLTDSLTDWQQNIELLWADNLTEVWSLSWVTQLGLRHSNHLIVVKKVVHWILTNGSKNIVANMCLFSGIFFLIHMFLETLHVVGKEGGSQCFSLKNKKWQSLKQARPLLFSLIFSKPTQIGQFWLSPDINAFYWESSHIFVT